MNIGLVDVDGRHYPNFALMKLSAWHKQHGDSVSWYEPLFCHPDKVYASKIFTFTPDYDFFPADADVEKGGTGYDFKTSLPEEIDRMLPDYSIYPEYDFAIGFLSRGCIRKCSWCVVPKKEGAIRQYDDIERIAQGRRHIVLMDNNFLANEPEFVREQLSKSVRLKLKIDFNQGLDARLVTPENAAWLARCNWKAATKNNAYIRFSCDTQSMIPHIKTAIFRLRAAGFKGHVFIYFLAKDVSESHDRIMQVMSFDNKIDPFVMPYRDFDRGGQIISQDLKRLARWCNMVSIRKSCAFSEYRG